MGNQSGRDATSAPAKAATGGCPMGHDQQGQAKPSDSGPATASAAAQGGCPMAGKDSQGLPPDRADRPGTSAREFQDDPFEESSPVLLAGVPATGMGNSDDGQTWQNPTSFQFSRALERRDKMDGESMEDIKAVTFVHNYSVHMSWETVKQWERALHPETEPRLRMFQGLAGHETFRSRWYRWRYGLEPYDRHDWMVDRSDGTSQRYILEYYEHPDEEDGTSVPIHSVDVRPDLSPAGVFDRLRFRYLELTGRIDPDGEAHELTMEASDKAQEAYDERFTGEKRP